MNRSLSPKQVSMPRLAFILIIVCLLTSSFSLVYPFLDHRDTIVYVDAQKLVNGYKGMQEARKEFESKTTAWQANLDTLRVELEANIEEYESSGGKLSEKEKSLMEELIQSKQEQFVNYQQVIAEKIKKEDQDLTSKVLSKVNDYVKQYGKENDYAIIMAATQFGNIVYAEDHTDITADVLEGLNAEYSR